jgi:hypothetical protein
MFTPPYVKYRPTACDWPVGVFLASHLALKIEDYCYVRRNFCTVNVGSYHTFYTLMCRTAVDHFSKVIWILRKILLLHSSVQASPSFHLLRVQLLQLAEVALKWNRPIGVQQTAFSRRIVVIRKQNFSSSLLVRFCLICSFLRRRLLSNKIKLNAGDGVKSLPMNIPFHSIWAWRGKYPVCLSRRVRSKRCLVEFIPVSLNFPMRWTSPSNCQWSKPDLLYFF